MVIRGDVLDIPDLQRRGLLKKGPEPERTGMKFTKDGLVDLRGVDKADEAKGDLLSSVFGGGSENKNSGSFWGGQEGASSSAEGPDVANPLSFMDSGSSGSESNGGIFGGGGNETSGGSFWDVGGGQSSSSVSSSSSSGSDSLEVQGLKNKIDDLEYKLDRLMERIAKLEGS